MPRPLVLPASRPRPGARRPWRRALTGGVPAPSGSRRRRAARRARLAAAALGAAATAFAIGLAEGFGAAVARTVAEVAARLIAARAGWAS